MAKGERSIKRDIVESVQRWGQEILNFNTAQKTVLLIGMALLVLRVGYLPGSERVLRGGVDPDLTFAIHCVGTVAVTGVGIYLLRSKDKSE